MNVQFALESSSPIVILGLGPGLDETDTPGLGGAGCQRPVGWTRLPDQDQLWLGGAGLGLDQMIMLGLDGLDVPPPFRGGHQTSPFRPQRQGKKPPSGRRNSSWERSHGGK